MHGSARRAGTGDKLRENEAERICIAQSAATIGAGRREPEEWDRRWVEVPSFCSGTRHPDLTPVPEFLHHAGKKGPRLPVGWLLPRIDHAAHLLSCAGRI